MRYEYEYEYESERAGVCVWLAQRLSPSARGGCSHGRNQPAWTGRVGAFDGLLRHRFGAAHAVVVPRVLRCLLDSVRCLLDPAVTLEMAGNSGSSQARTRLGWEPLLRLHYEVVKPIAWSPQGAAICGMPSAHGGRRERCRQLDRHDRAVRFTAAPDGRGRPSGLYQGTVDGLRRRGHTIRAKGALRS